MNSIRATFLLHFLKTYVLCVVLSNTSSIMKLIFLLFLNLFHEFAVHGDGETQNEEIDTNELDEFDQVLIANLTDVPLRSKMKRAFWTKLQEKNNLVKSLNNSFFSDVFCATNQIKVTLEKHFPGNLHKNFTPMNVPFPEYYIHFSPARDINLLIMQDHEWVPQYNKEHPSNISYTDYYNNVKKFKEIWLLYLCSKEGHELAKRIAPEILEVGEREILLERFSYCMSRLFIISCACRKLLEVLKYRIIEDPTQSLLEHFRQLVPLWSVTYEQIKFYNKLARHVYPHSQRLKMIKFGNATIYKHEFFFVVPHTKDNCGFRKGNEVDLDEDTSEYKT